MWGLIDANHQAVFVDQTSGAIYRYATFAVAASSFSGSFVSYTPSTDALGISSGVTVGQGSAHASFAPRYSITGYLGFSSAGLPAYSFDDSYQQSLYGLAASFATIAGTYSFTSGSNSVTLTVTGKGAFTLSYSGCSGSGSFAIPNASYNAYELSGSLSCSGSTQTITGLASFTPASGSTAAELTLEYDNGSSQAVEAVAKQ
jgi:hypothetical protein